MKTTIFEATDGDGIFSIGVPSNRGDQSHIVIKSNGDDVMLDTRAIRLLRDKLIAHLDENTKITDHWYEIAGWRHYFDGPIFAADVRANLRPDQRGYSLGIVGEGQKVDYVNDSTPIPSGSELCAVPPCGF